MEFENIAVWGFEHAFRGMRNPMNSWSKSDSVFTDADDFVIGEKDLALAQKLIRAGSEHRKFMRQIFVSVDIIAPAYFMAELDTYKIGVTRNSSSFMHKGVSKPFEIADFECDDADDEFWEKLIEELNRLRDLYLDTGDYQYFRNIRQLLPQSYLYRSTVTMSYENVYNICRQRKNHKLIEWSGSADANKCSFISWAHTLPYADELIFADEQPLDRKG